MTTSDTLQRVSGLSCWKGAIEAEPLEGGITNLNFVVTDQGRKYFVRLGHDIPLHGVMRFNELAASRAAHAAGLSPEVIYAEPGVLVLDFIEGRTLNEDAVRQPENLDRILDLVARCHRDVPGYLRGPALVFWVFHVIRDYAATLKESDSPRVAALEEILTTAARLESAVGPVELVYGHNDLLAANFIDDGSRLWLIDWDYAGFNSPLFDLANLASNNGLTEAQEKQLLEDYSGSAPERSLWISYLAMKTASLLRESMWSMVSEVHSAIDFDFVAYTEENLKRYEAALRRFEDEMAF